MRLELAERLICPAAHEPTPLIVVALETVGRDLRRARLGCMRCHREGEIREGSVLLGRATSARNEINAAPIPTADAVLRLAALLDLSEPDRLLLLGTRHAAFATPLAGQHGAIVAVHGASGVSPDGVGHVEVAEDRVPFAAATFAAATLDASMSAGTLADALRCVRVGGRIVGDADVPLPAGVRELARDTQGWVGELVASPSPVVSLRRA